MSLQAGETPQDQFDWYTAQAARALLACLQILAHMEWIYDES